MTKLGCAVARKPTQPPLILWAMSDGRAGIEAQARGLAEAVARRRDCEIVVKRIGWKGDLGRLPWWLTLFPRRWLTPESDVSEPWPDILIAAGRATLPLAIRMKKWSGGKTFVVQIQDPRVPPAFFDLVIPPNHDRLKGDNIVSIIGAPHRVTAEKLVGEYARFAPLIDPLPRPRAAVLIGGKSKAFDLTPERAAKIANDIQHFVADAFVDAGSAHRVGIGLSPLGKQGHAHRHEPLAPADAEHRGVLGRVARGAGERFENRVALHLVVVFTDDGLARDDREVDEKIAQGLARIRQHGRLDRGGLFRPAPLEMARRRVVQL